MNRIFAMGGVLALSVMLTGCPAGTQQDAAKASLQVTIVMNAAQRVEISAHNSRMIPDSDHQFIQKQFITLAEADKAANTCISQAANHGAVIACVNTAIATVDQINQQGGTFLKSESAKANFNMALTSIKSILQTISVTLGGTP